MSITQSAAVEAVRERLDEPIPSFYTDTQIRRWLNDAVREIARRAEWKRAYKDYAVDVSSEDQVVALDTNVLRVYRVEWRPTAQSAVYRLEYRDINAMDVIWGVYQEWSGQPGWYTMINANPLSILISPAATQDGHLRVFYYDMPTDLTTNAVTSASTALTVPTGWEDLAVEFATAMGHRKARDVQSYQMAMEAFTSRLQALIECSVRYSDEAASITPDWNAWGDVYGEWLD